MINEKIGGGAESLDLSGYLNGGWTLGTNGFIRAKKVGRVVTIIAYNLTNNTGSQAVISTLPEWLKPVEITCAPCTDIEALAWTMMTQVEGANLYIANPNFSGFYTTGKHYRFCIVYVSKI